MNAIINISHYPSHIIFKLFIFDNHSSDHAVKFNNNGIVSFDFLINRTMAMVHFLNKTESWSQKVNKCHYYINNYRPNLNCLYSIITVLITPLNIIMMIQCHKLKDHETRTFNI